MTLTIVCIPLEATLAGVLGIRILPELGWRELFPVGGLIPTAVRATGVGSAASVGRVGGLLSTFVGAWALDLAGPKAFFTVFAIAVTVTIVALALVERHIRRT